MKRAWAIVLLLLALSAGALFLPGSERLERYDVQDMTYSMTDWPSVDISLADSQPGWFSIDYWVGTELAAEAQRFIPGSSGGPGSRGVQFQNGVLIVRATPVQHVAVRLRLAVARMRIQILEGVNRCVSRLPGPRSD